MDAYADSREATSLTHRQTLLIVLGVLLPTFMGSLDQTILSSAVDGFHRGFRHQIVADAVDTVRQPPASRDVLVTVLGSYGSTIRTSALITPGERIITAGDSRK